jgi:hypothetical protein
MTIQHRTARYRAALAGRGDIAGIAGIAGAA